jgi:hypothetical protein
MMDGTIAILAAIWWILMLGLLLPQKRLRDVIREADKAEWDYKRTLRIFCISAVVCLALAPSLTPIPGRTFILTIIVQILFAARLVSARLLHEMGPGWVFYAVLNWTSPFWVPLIVNIRYSLPK